MNVIKGYKILPSNLKCRYHQYKIGLNIHYDYEFKAYIELGVLGLHFCLRAVDCLVYYPLNKNNRYFEVSAIDTGYFEVSAIDTGYFEIDTGNIYQNKVIHGDNKSVTNNLYLDKELTMEKFASLCNGTIHRDTYYGKRFLNRYTYEIKNGRKHGSYSITDSITDSVFNIKGFYYNNVLHGECVAIYFDGTKEVRIYNHGKLSFSQHYKKNGEKEGVFMNILKNIIPTSFE